jgi:hypothetical protein
MPLPDQSGVEQKSLLRNRRFQARFFRLQREYSAQCQLQIKPIPPL